MRNCSTDQPPQLMDRLQHPRRSDHPTSFLSGLRTLKSTSSLHLRQSPVQKHVPDDHLHNGLTRHALERGKLLMHL